MTVLTKLNFKKKILCKSFCITCFLTFLVSIGLQVYVSNNSAIKSNELISLSEKKVSLEKEIASINYELTFVSCLSNIEKLAREKGFIDMSDPLLVVKPSSVAMAR